MALSGSPIGKPMAGSITKDTLPGLTLAQDVRNGSVTLYSVDIDVASGAARDYLKIFDSTGSGIVPGTDLPDLVLYTDGSKTLEMEVIGGLLLSNGLSYFAATDNGNDAATIPPVALVTHFVTS